MMKKNYTIYLQILFILCVSLGTVQAQSFGYSQLQDMPKSVEKDYYIWRFLSLGSTSSTQAQTVIYQANHINSKLRKAYRNKTGQNPPKIQTVRQTTPDHIWKNRSYANKAFRQGLTLMRQGNPELASGYFDSAQAHYIKRYEKDKALFWLYLSSKNKTYLQKLRNSYSANIYTLIAHDKADENYPKIDAKNFSQHNISGFDIKNPISWARIKAKMNAGTDRQINNLADRYASKETLGIYTYLKAKASHQKKSFYPMPYRSIIKKLHPKRQALIYAIARQESRFVPASVSRSFALGMMQFMPFLVKDIAKKKGYTMDLNEMFNPHRALEFADYHLNYLNNYLYHPLFVAYAYNAGIGFTKRHLRKARNFRYGAYEPYMSMESMKNVEAREYGKKVLSNYVIYLNKLGVPTRMSSLIKTLTSPAKTDRFR